MGRIRDLTGQVFREITFISYQGKTSYGHALWLCKCHCGKQFTTVGAQITNTSGTTKSCGCLRIIGKFKHGDWGLQIYKCWTDMLHRCNKPNNRNYHNYGGRGIKVCERWYDYLNFKEDMLPTFKAKLTLDRIDVNGNYCFENCRWATVKEQQNNKRTNHLIDTPIGIMNVSELAKICGLNRGLLFCRLKVNPDISFEMLIKPSIRPPKS